MKSTTLSKIAVDYNLKKKEDIQQVRNKYNALNDLDDQTFNRFLEDYDIDLNERYGKFDFGNGNKVTVQIYKEDMREKRRGIRDSFRTTLFDGFVDLQNERKDVVKRIPDIPENRDFPLFFSDYKVSETETLKGVDFVKKLKKCKTNEEKVNLINERVDKLMNRIETLFQPCNDEEFTKRYNEMSKITTIFMYDGLANGIENYANITFDEKTKDKFIGLKEYSNGLSYKMVERATKIANASYEFMNDVDVNELSKVTNDISLFDHYDVTFESNEIDPLADFKSLGERLGFTHDPLKSITAIKKVKEGDILFGTNGPVSIQEANELLKNDKILGVVDANGTKKAVGFDSDYRIVSKEVHKDFNKKKACQKMLDTLNKETHMFNHSSKEYRNMRNALAKMVKGKGNDYELIATIKENARKYFENHEFKTKKEGLATRRKECVENMLQQLKDCEFDILVGDSIRNYELSKDNVKQESNELADIKPNNVNGNDSKSVVSNKEANQSNIENRLAHDLKTVNNSDKNYIINKETNIMSNTNQMSADDQINQERVGN